MSEVAATNTPRRRKILAILILLTLFAITALALLPQAIGYAIKEWAKEQGGEQITVGNIDFNPFTASFQLENLKITGKEGSTFALPELDLQLEWLPLWERQIVITGLSITGAEVQLIHDAKGQQIIVGGMTFSLQTTEAKSTDIPWGLKLNRIELTKSNLNYKGPDFSSLITLNQLTLKGLSTIDKNNTVDLSLDGTLDQASIKLDGTVIPFSSSPGFTGKISIKDLQLQHYKPLVESQLELIEGALNTEGKLSLHLPLSKSAEITFDGTFALNDLQLTQSPLRLSGDRFAWNGTIDIKSGRYTTEGKLTTEKMRYEAADGLSYQHANALWSGALNLQAEADNNQITASGKADLIKSTLKTADTDIALEQVEFTIQQSTITLGTGNLQAALTGTLNLKNSAVASPKVKLQSESLNWEGATRISQTETGLSSSIEGVLNSDSLQLKDIKSNADLKYAMLTWQGSFTLDQTATQTLIKPMGSLHIEHPLLTDTNAALTLLSADAINLGQLTHHEDGSIVAEQIAIRSLAIGKLLQGDNPPPLLAIAELNINQPSFSPDAGVIIETLSAVDFQQHVHRYPDKHWNASVLVNSINQLSHSDDGQNKSATEPLPIEIGKLSITGDSLVTLHDQTTKPAYQTQLKPTLLTITGINSNTPDTPAIFELKGILGESSNISLAGTLAPFATKSTFDLKGQIEGLALPPLSAYTIPLMGYKLQSGKANSDIQLSAKAGQLEGRSDLTLNQLEVEPLSAEKMAALQTQLSIPLETALGMLKDKNNQIKLSLPINGDMDNINVDPSDAINQAIGRAMKKGAKTYLATALFPFGTLLTLVELAGDAAAKVQLDPIQFESGSDQLKSDQYAYLEKIAQLLNDRAEIHIRLCGVSVESDRQTLLQKAVQKQAELALAKKKEENTENKKPTAQEQPLISIGDDALNKLASDRATAIERHLSERHDIKGDRLITCAPQIESDKQKGTPRADLLI